MIPTIVRSAVMRGAPDDPGSTRPAAPVKDTSKNCFTGNEAMIGFHVRITYIRHAGCKGNALYVAARVVNRCHCATDT